MASFKKLVSRLFARISKKTMLMAIAATLVTSGVASGTLAWLIDRTPEVTNTFTYGDINITLEETDNNVDQDGNPNTNEYNMTPGSVISKDPRVTVLANSEDSWVFVKLVKSDNFDDFMSFEIAEGWTALAGVDGVYYRQADNAEQDVVYPVLKDNKVNVSIDVTKEMLNNLDADGVANYPQLIISAYAIQRDDAIADLNNAASAWNLIEAENTATAATNEGESIVTQSLGQ